MSKKIILTFAVVLLISAAISAQAVLPSGQGSVAGGTPGVANLQLAVSSRDYPVTLGDVYRLTYRSTAGTMINLDVQVDGSGIVSLGVFGKLDANGLTFVELKQKAEDLISKNYSHSLPELSIQSPGVFRIAVRDTPSRFQYVPAWGLSRLSDIVGGYESGSVSLRRVDVASRDGSVRTYDLLSSDPLVKPGDTVTLRSPARSVRLEGEVRRPGTYELLEGEGLQELIEDFGGGITSAGDSRRLRVDHSSSQGGSTEYVAVPDAYGSAVALGDGDSVLVRASSERLSLIWFEGAVDSASADQDSALRGGASPDAASAQATAPAALPGAGTQEMTNNRFSYQIRGGQMLSDALQDVRSYFQPLADLSYATYFPSVDSLQGERVNIPALLSGSDMSSDVTLVPGARIVIPTVNLNVMVSGAVYAPGSVLYRPNSPAGYYMIQAGGIDPWRNSFGSYKVLDAYGKRRKSSEPIQPGDQIHVNENSFFYQLERRVPVLASILALTTSVITLTLVYGP